MKGADFLDHQAASRPKIRRASDYWGPLEKLWHHGLERGESTGYPSLDEFYTIMPGQLTIVTGWPGSGKSAWVDSVACNLLPKGWDFTVYSPEHQPTELHISMLSEKLSRRPFGTGPTPRMSLEEVGRHVDDISEHMRFITVGYEDSITIPDLIHAANDSIKSMTGGKRGLIIDPWNEIQHWRPNNMTETEYVSHALSMLRNWARKVDAHVWLVAHPAKQPKIDGKLPVPTMMDISGSQNFWNKADVGICVWREFDSKDTGPTSIVVQKVKFKHVGRRGIAYLKFDRVTGTYSDPSAQIRRVV